MKFIVSLIYVLAAVLLFCLLGEYIYFSALQQQHNNPHDNTLANVSLMLFVFASLIISLILIWLESLPNTENKSPLEKYLEEVRSVQENPSSTDDIQLNNLTKKLEHISNSLTTTAKTLNLGLENINTRLDDIENVALSQKYPVRNPTEASKIADKYIEQQMQPKLQKIFNKDLADTLSSLEIMQENSNTSSSNASQTEPQIKHIYKQHRQP